MRPYLLRLSLMLVAVGLAGCGARKDATNQSDGGNAVEKRPLTKLQLTSTAFDDGQPIPAQYSCDGSGQSPPLAWGEPPPATKSFAVIVDDPDAPGGTFAHWGAYDIPASARSITAGQSFGSQALDGFGKSGYGAPCPPKGHGPHHYRFKLYALDRDPLDVRPNAKVEEVENEAQKHAIAQGELIGTYERK